MSFDTRQQIEELVDQAWELHDETGCEQTAEMYRIDIMELLSKLPENEIILKIVQ